MQKSDTVVKIVILGDGRVGKTCVTLKYCKNTFDAKEESTINADFLEKKINIGYKQQIQAAIWDTAGQERFRSLAPMYYRDALGYLIEYQFLKGAIIVYDVSSKESFDKVPAWVKELKQNAQSEEQEIQIIIAGNKSDLNASSHQVSKEEAEELAKNLGTAHIYTSAKTGVGIKALFETLAQSEFIIQYKLLQEIVENQPEVAYNLSRSQNPSILGEPTVKKDVKKGPCC